MVDQHGQRRQEMSPPPLPDHGERGQSFAVAVAVVVSIMTVVMLLSFLLPIRNPALNGDSTGAQKVHMRADTRQTDGVGNVTNGATVAAAESHPGSPSSGSPIAATHVDHLSSGSSGTPEKAELGGSGDGEQNVETVAVEEPQSPTRSSDDLPANTFLTLGGQPNSGPPTLAENRVGDRTNAEFFGVEAKGRKFVYVVDVSSSMMGDKFESARHELIESIGRLGDGQSFFIAFFNDTSHYQPSKGFVPARSRRKKREISNWIMRAFPSGGTSPFEAIAFAIKLRPDAIYVLSDGEFDPSVNSKISLMNATPKTLIHTISFGTDAFTLRDLASCNGGTYRHVR